MTHFPKKNYQDHLHFTFLSGSDVVFLDGELWKLHSSSVKVVFDCEIPIYQFVTLSYELFECMGSGGVHRFTNLVQVCVTIFSEYGRLVI
jgi:hypothetical protein